MDTFIGTASWNIPKLYKSEFSSGGSQLESYATRLNAVEINSSFYKDHMPSTYVRWAESVPGEFKFSVKLSREFTHKARLKVDSSLIRKNLQGISELKEKLGAILIQLPPSLEFDPTTATEFFEKLRAHYSGPLVLEPRHDSWVSAPSFECSSKYLISRVIADPNPLPDVKGFSSSIYYFRLHGAPEVYKSAYSDEQLRQYAQKVKTRARNFQTWCIFDNTTFGHATGNALNLKNLLKL